MKQENVLNEKNVMSKCRHPFILALHNTYKDEHRLYLLLEYCNGGELFNVIHTPSRDGIPPKSARFYCGCCLLALGYLLEKSIMYRDLKPENMLVDAKGYLKLIDFGFAKFERGQALTLCGTPEYMAPEIILGRQYDISVDWWAFGVLVYECLAGVSPFAARDQKVTCRQIVQRKFSFPKSSAFDQDACDLINRLLQISPKDRLVTGESGLVGIKSHPWFRHMDWHSLLAKNTPPPWQPQVRSALDTRNFDAYGFNDKVDARWRDPNPGWDAPF